MESIPDFEPSPSLDAYDLFIVVLSVFVPRFRGFCEMGLFLK